MTDTQIQTVDQIKRELMDDYNRIFNVQMAKAKTLGLSIEEVHERHAKRMAGLDKKAEDLAVKRMLDAL